MAGYDQAFYQKVKIPSDKGMFYDFEDKNIGKNKSCEPPQHAALVWMTTLYCINFAPPLTIVVTTYFLRKNSRFLPKKACQVDFLCGNDKIRKSFCFDE